MEDTAVNDTSVESKERDAQELATTIVDRLSMLDEKKEVVDGIDRDIQKLTEQRKDAAAEYKTKIAEVRSEGYVTDQLLGHYGHPAARRGRPRKSL